MKPRDTRRSHTNRIASHLTATVTWLWLKGLAIIVLGLLLGATMIADKPRPSQRLERRIARPQEHKALDPSILRP